MLKKLVRYGNSNALVLDKAILELLNISEGSMVKLKTDGSSLIITPVIENQNQQVQETLTSTEVVSRIGIRQALEKENFSIEQKESIEKEWVDLMNNPKIIQKDPEIIKNFMKKYNLWNAKAETYEQGFSDVFKKHQATQVKITEVMATEEYQHKAQLLSEKFQGNKNSKEFIEAMQQLICEFYPQARELYDNLRKVAKDCK